TQTAGQISDLEMMPLEQVEYCDTAFQEMDTAAILARRPAVVLVDEYAHSNAPGSRNEKRWQDVEQLLDAGIDVISTLNIQHLESLNDVISRITGTVQRETVPDDIVRRANQLELVDMSPEAIRRRMAHGNIYPAERVDAALANYFRPGNLSALRELALLWLADRVEESLTSYLDAHGISEAWETRERVVVGITGYPGGEAQIRRAARMAGRVSGELIGVHIAVDDGLAQADAAALNAQRKLVTELGGSVHEVVGHDPAETMAAFARQEKATQLVLGSSRRSRWHEIVHGSFVARVTRLAGNIDVHVIAQVEDQGLQDRVRRAPPPSSERRRVIAGWLLTVFGLPALIAATLPLRSSIDLSTEILLVLVFVLAIAAIGGRFVGAAAAVVASLLLNWFFVVPYHTLIIAEADHVISLVVFIAVAVTVGALVDTVSRRSLEARRARLEAEALVRSTTSLAADPEPIPRLVEHVKSTFDLHGVVLSTNGAAGQVTVAAAGNTDAPLTATLRLPSGSQGGQGEETTLEVFGRTLSDDDQRLLRALADQLALAIDNHRLAKEAGEATALAGVDAVRTALLRAVSHDLRSPIASIKAMISGLRDPAVAWTPQQLSEAHATVEEETDRLNRLVGNLLDASRLQIGALAVNIQASTMSDVVSAALQSVKAPRSAVQVDIPLDTPLALCDSTLLERTLANIIGNALRFSPEGATVGIDAAAIGPAVHIRVVDRGVGISPSERSKVLSPFQRLGDNPNGDGVGLGLSIAQGFVDAMNGTMTLDDTPGGGLTVTIALPSAVGVP
ncbi:MAG: ATP-binding protein, partial [Candidatus Limnocylindrales bacterium]